MFNLTSTSFEQKCDNCGIYAVPRNLAFFIQIPLLKSWKISFLYNYTDSSNKNITNTGVINLSNFQFQSELRILSKNGKYFLQILSINLMLGDSEIKFNNSPTFLLNFILFMINSAKPIFSLFVNYFARDIINTILPYMPLAAPIPIIGPYGFDFGLYQDIEMTQNQTICYFKAEGIHMNRSSRVTVDPPKDLKTVPILTPSTIDFVMNELPLNSLFATMAQDGTITIDDAYIYQMTNFLHLRTSDLVYYIPGLMEFGDLPMELRISAIEKLSYMKMTILNNEIKMLGKASIDFNIPHQTDAISFETDLNFSSTLDFNSEMRDLSAQINMLEIPQLKIIKSDIKKLPDVNDIKEDFNTLTGYVKNAANIYCEAPIFHVDYEYTIGELMKIKVNDIKMKIDEGIFGIGTDLNIEFLNL